MMDITSGPSQRRWRRGYAGGDLCHSPHVERPQSMEWHPLAEFNCHAGLYRLHLARNSLAHDQLQHKLLTWPTSHYYSFISGS